MLESKELEEITYQDVQEFVDLKLEEGTRLDYKQELIEKLPLHVCAMANTQGGHILIGVAEEATRQGELKLNIPRGDILGVEHGGKDLRARWRDKIASRTNPRLVPGIKVIPVEGDGSKAVIVIRVEASTNAPHEVAMGEDPKILVRRADSSRVATLDEIERMIERRNKVRERSFGQLDMRMSSAYFSRGGGFERRDPPRASALLRPRRLASAGFTPDHRLDRELRELALGLKLMDTVDERPIAQGSALEQRPSDSREDGVLTRLEVHANGEIKLAQTLNIDRRDYIDSSGGREQTVRISTLNLQEVMYFLQRAVVFSSRAHEVAGRRLELEAYFELEGCSGCRVEIPVVSQSRPLNSQRAEIRDSPLSMVTVSHDPGQEDLLSVTREVSRACGLSVPDWRLEGYVLDLR